MGAARKSGPSEFPQQAILIRAMKTAAFRVRKCAKPGVHTVEARSTRSFPRHTHDQFGIGVIRAGAQRSMSGRGIVEAGPGMVITVNPGEVHDGMPIGDAGRSWAMLYFDPAVLQDVADGLERTHGAFEFHRPVVESGDLAGRVNRLFAAMTDGDGDGLEAEELALMLVEWLLPSAKPDAGHGVSPVGHAKRLIDDAPAEPISLAILAGLSGVSRFQFLRSFARTTGLTPHAYMLQKRVDLARRLIAKGMPLAETSAESGFFDQSHMTRNFTRILGITPGAYAAAMQ